jgi:hypothetical protein
MTDAPPRWHLLSDIQQELTRFNHPLRRALTYGEYESAIANAVRSGEVAVRGRLREELAYWRSNAFDRIEGRLNSDAHVDILGNKITICETYVDKPFKHSTFAIKKTLRAESYVDVQADLRGVEKWIRENAAPRWWQDALAKEETACELIGVNEQKRAAVLEAISSIGCDNLRKMQQKNREATIIAMVAQDHGGLEVSDRYVRELFMEALRERS